MKFKIGKLPTNENINTAEWNLIKEPSNIWITQIIVFPIGIITTGLIFFMLNYFAETPFPPFGIMGFLVLLFLIPIHEIIHAIFFPGGLVSKKTTIGFWPSAAAFYAWHDGVMTRNRYLAVLMAPLIIMSILLTLVVQSLQLNSDYVILFILMNAFGSCVDVFGSALLLFQVPRNGVQKWGCC